MWWKRPQSQRLFKLASVADTGQCATEDVKALTEFEILSQCITELENREKAKKQTDVRRIDNIPIQNRLVKLVGDKPLIDCKIGGVGSQVLWDTGSQISSLSLDWVKENFPEAELRPISDFLEEGENVKFTAANNTEVPMVGVSIWILPLENTRSLSRFLLRSRNWLDPS